VGKLHRRHQRLRRRHERPSPGETASAPDSGYLFEAALDILNAGVGVPLLMGEFTHFNEVIPVPNLSGVDLHFGFDTNGAPASVNAVFPFAHNETPNNTGRRRPTTTSSRSRRRS
jgi:hypothetical protein